MFSTLIVLDSTSCLFLPRPPAPPPAVDLNRVVLDELEGKEDSDYINASYIDGYYNRVEFIATQHPLENTVKDFWRMVVERSVNTVVVFGPLNDPKVMVLSLTSTERLVVLPMT